MALRTSSRPGAITRPSEPETRVIDAALVCVARWGITKTTLDDIARESGVSRATIYRLFPGGKASLVQAVGQREVALLLSGLSSTFDAAETLEDLVATGIVAVADALASHAALAYLLAHEPRVLLPFLAFDRLDPALALSTAVVGPHIARFVPEDVAREIAEWAARLVLSFTFAPGAVDLRDENDVRAFVRTYLQPHQPHQPHQLDNRGQL